MEPPSVAPRRGQRGSSLSRAFGGGKSLSELCPGLLCWNPSQESSLPGTLAPWSPGPPSTQHPPCISLCLAQEQKGTPWWA